MSDKKDKDDKPKKGKGLMMKVVGGLVLVGAGIGGTYGAMASGLLPGGSHAEKAKPQGPQLVRKGEEDPYAPPAGKGEEGGVELVYGEGGSEYRTAYYTFEGEFTSNLRDSAGLVQLALAASTRRDGRVLMWLKEHELAIRSRILVEIANTGEEEIISPEGKKKLQQRLTAAINDELKKHEGFGGVDDVYFRNFIVQ